MIASCGATCDKESLRYNKNLFYEHKQILYTSCDQLFCRMLFLTFIIKCIMYKARKTLKWMRKLHYKHQIPSLPNIMKQFLPLKNLLSSSPGLSLLYLSPSLRMKLSHILFLSPGSTAGVPSCTVCKKCTQSVRVFADIYWAARNVAPDTKKNQHIASFMLRFFSTN